MSDKNQKPAVKTDEAEKNIPKHRQCPLCFTGPMRGVGTVYCTQDSTRYYKCQCCGHTWTAMVKTEIINVSHKTVELDGQRDA